MSKVVGIDLGTTNSLVAYVKDGVPVVIRDESGDGLVPSVVSVGEEGTIFVGREAQRRLLTSPERTVYSVKRFMGRGIDDVHEDARLLPFDVGGEDGGVVRIGVAGKEFTPPEISAFVLRELRRRAEEHFREEGEFDFEVDRAVITVPAYFNDAQRTATRDAGRLAGLEVLRIINEPTAASLAYGLDKRNRGTIAVYDLGGGTFDISILRVEDGVFQVLATNGDTHLGGDDIDTLLTTLVLADIGHSAAEGHVVQAIRKAGIQAKLDLSEMDEAEIRVDSGPAVPRGYLRRITRADFEEMIRDLVQRTVDPCRQALADAGLEPKNIDEAVLVGGSTRIPLVRRLVEELFGRKPHADLNPDEVVALGAAVQADILVSGRREMLLLDVTPLSLGLETLGSVMTSLIPRNTTIPTSKKETFSTATDNQSSVTIHVLQGERPMASDNRSLGKFDLTGLPPGARGVPQIEVEFAIDANGILNVSATDVATKKKQEIKITGSSGLSKDDIEKMKREAEAHAAEDKARRELVDLRNQAEQVVYGAKKAMTDLGDKVPPATRSAVESAVSTVEERVKGDDAVAIQKAVDALNQAAQELGKISYESAKAEGGASTAGTAGGADGAKAQASDDVIDAEYEVKDS